MVTARWNKAQFVKKKAQFVKKKNLCLLFTTITHMANFGNLTRDGFLGNLRIHGKEIIDKYGNIKANSIQVEGNLNVGNDLIVNGQIKREFETRELKATDCARRATNGDPSERYDIIICGAGTAGSLLVYRLAEQFPTANILVLEAGKDDVQDNETMRTPQDGPNPNQVDANPLLTDDWGQLIRGVFSGLGEGAQAIQQPQRSTTNDQYIPQQKILGMACGMTLGGTSAINAQIWNRGTKQGTYDKWEAATESSDFGWIAMNESLKAIENRSQIGQYYGQNIPLWQVPAAPLPPSYKFNPLYHGDSGRIMLFQGQLDSAMDSAVLAVASAGFGGRVLAINLDAEDPTNPGEYVSPAPTTDYSQSDPNFVSFNPYPATTPGSTYVPPGPGGITRGPEYANGAPQKLGGATRKKAYKARCFAAPAFLYPLQYPTGNPEVPNNVTIKTKVYVTKLIFDNLDDPLECTGVEYVENGWHVANVARAISRDVKPWVNTFSNVDRSTCTLAQAKINQAVALSGGIKKAYAKTDVWLCMGALGSPAILQRSGIGSRDLLENLNYSPVNCILDLPGVGRNVQDTCDLPLGCFHEIDQNTYLPAYTGAPASGINPVYESVFGLADPANLANAVNTSSISGAPTRGTFGGTRLRLKSTPTLDVPDFDTLIIDRPIQFVPFGNELWADLVSLLTNTASTIDTLHPKFSASTFDRSKIGQYNGNGSLETIPTFVCASEFWNAQSKGEVSITSGNVFDRPNYAPNMLSNENDLESFENLTENSLIPLITQMASQRYGPRGPFSYAYVIGTGGHIATTTDVQLAASVAVSLFKPFASAYHISQPSYETPGALIGATLTMATGAAAVPGNNQRIITAWSGNTGNAATSYVATVGVAFAGLPVAFDQYALALATELPLDIVQFNDNNHRNFVRFLPFISEALFSDINKQTLGATPFTTTAASTRVSIAATSHNLSVGEYIKISGVTGPVDTIAESEFNNYHVVDAVPDPNTFEIVLFWNNTARPGTPGAPVYPSPAASAVGGSFGNAGIIVHTLNFDRIKFREFLFNLYFSGWHPASSCRMGPPTNSESVVDTRARVYNTLGLRVCDASILPTKPNANTQAPIYGIAQRLSELVIPEYQTLL